jgi:hypothetical protein
LLPLLAILFIVEHSVEGYGRWIYGNPTFKLSHLNLSFVKFKFKFPAMMLILASTLLKQPFRFTLLEGGRHGIGGIYWEEILLRIKDFFDEYVRDGKKYPDLELR